MGKRKSSSKPQTGKRGPPPLDTQFSCVFCNNPKSVSVKMDLKDENMGYLQCKICGQRFQSKIDHLSAPIDVYTDWTDACEEAQAAHDADQAAGGGGSYSHDPSSSSNARRRSSPGSQSPEQATARLPPKKKARPTTAAKKKLSRRKNDDSDESEEESDGGNRRSVSPPKKSAGGGRKMVSKGGAARGLRHDSLEATDSD